ncbi:MAG TPA: hypothetical protein VFI02_12305 [Armatimonadota bacterium]|nr:hypothetical protein [Armatimonadota bacterium]
MTQDDLQPVSPVSIRSRYGSNIPVSIEIAPIGSLVCKVNRSGYTWTYATTLESSSCRSASDAAAHSSVKRRRKARISELLIFLAASGLSGFSASMLDFARRVNLSYCSKGMIPFAYANPSLSISAFRDLSFAADSSCSFVGSGRAST